LCGPVIERFRVSHVLEGEYRDGILLKSKQYQEKKSRVIAVKVVEILYEIVKCSILSPAIASSLK
jgi:hypothetical protein